MVSVVWNLSSRSNHLLCASPDPITRCQLFVMMIPFLERTRKIPSLLAHSNRAHRRQWDEVSVPIRLQNSNIPIGRTFWVPAGCVRNDAALPKPATRPHSAVYINPLPLFILQLQYLDSHGLIRSTGLLTSLTSGAGRLNVSRFSPANAKISFCRFTFWKEGILRPLILP